MVRTEDDAFRAYRGRTKYWQTAYRTTTRRDSKRPSDWVSRTR